MARELLNTLYVTNLLRFAAIGIVEDVELYVVYTMRGDVTRIISARRARKDERQEYYHTFGE